MIDNSVDLQIIQFKFPLSILIQLHKHLKTHSIYQYAIDLLSKNKIEQEYQLLNLTDKVK